MEFLQGLDVWNLVFVVVAFVLGLVGRKVFFDVAKVARLKKEIQDVLDAHNEAAEDGKWTSAEVKKFVKQVWEALGVLVPKLPQLPF